LNRDSSATNKTLLQRGHFGRLRSLVARTHVDGAWHANWTIIVDPPQRSLSTPNLAPSCAPSVAHPRRLCETLVAAECSAVSRAERRLLTGFSPLFVLSRWGLDRRAIGPAGKEAILQFAVGVEFVRQKPADHEQNHDNAQCNEGTAAAAVLAIMVRHAKAFLEYFGLTR
jgi:hypothetical protein